MRKITHWLEAYSEGESLDILCDVAETCALSAGTAKGRALAELIRKGDFRKVLSFEIPLDDIQEVRYLRQAVAFFSKLEFLDVGVDRKAVAISAFLEAEELCRETNARFKAWHEGSDTWDPFFCAVLHVAQGHVSRILGPRPTLSALRYRFGPGATSLTRKRESSVKRKLGRGISCSEDLVGWARALLGEMPHLAELHATQVVMDGEDFWGTVPVVIHEGAVSFVRKNAKTDRTTETQPTLNGMLQLAIGDYMSARCQLNRGLDLRDQTLNQRLARIGSLTDALATLDLKSASNCIAVRLVQSLLPEDWYSMLKAARAGTTKVPGVGSVKLEMFSGMGNGYTFPLQSVIFYSLAMAVATVAGKQTPIVSVYGDDIIVDSDMACLVAAVLTHCGLVVNKEKSYVTGPFRESCGADFLLGIDVRPIYVKKLLTPAVLFALHNGLVRKGFSDLAKRVRSYVHPVLALYGPDDYGDGHLVLDTSTTEFPPSLKPKGRHRGWEGFTFDTFATSSKRDWTYHPGDRVLPQYTVYMRGEEQIADKIPGLERAFKDPITFSEVSRPWGGYCSFLRAWMTGHGSLVEPSLPIPFGEDPDSSWGPVLVDPETGLGVQGRAKAPTFPGVDGYRKVTIYILR